MTLDNSQSAVPTPAAEVPATKPARRRATRTAAPPVRPNPVAEQSRTAEPDPQPVATAEADAAKAPAKARRTTRRATRATAAESTDGSSAPSRAPRAQAPDTPAAELPDSEVPRAEAPAAKKATRSRRAAKPVLDVLSEFGVATPAPAEPEPAEPVLAEPAPARTTRRRASRKAAVPAADSPAPAPAAEPAGEAAVEPAPESPAAPEPLAASASEAVNAAPTKPRRRRAVRGESAATAGPESSGSAADTAPTAPSAPSRRASRSRSASASVPASEASAPDARAQEVAAAEPAPSRRVAGSAAGASAPTTPRLATTALLFQAPDPALATRRSRRAQTPAGPPRHADQEAPVEAAAPEAPEVMPVEAIEPPATRSDSAEDARRQRRSRRAERAAGAVVEALAGAGSSPAGSTSAGGSRAASTPAAVTTELTKDELAAIEEVEAIESELIAEGVDLVATEFGPEDFRPDEDVDDEGDGDIADDEGDEDGSPRRRRRRGGRGRKTRPEVSDGPAEVDAEPHDEPAEGAASEDESDEDADTDTDTDGEGGSSRRRRRRRRGGRLDTESPRRARSASDEVTALKGSTRLEAKRQRRKEGRDAGRRRQIITEAEFLARREAVERSMVVRERDGRTQIAVLEDGVLVEHYVSQQSQASMAGNVYLGRVQNVLPSMEAAFIDVGKGRNAVLYAGEVNWDAAGLEGQPRRIEQALKSGDSVLVQVTKDPIGHKGARLTSQVTLAGRYLVLVPGGGMTGISRKLPDTERARLKKILREVVPEGSGVIVRTAAEGASEEELRADVERLEAQWAAISAKAKSASAPALLQGEPDMAIRVVRDIFNDDFTSLVVQGPQAWQEISTYVEELAPDLRERVTQWADPIDLFTVHRVDEQLAKGLDRKVWLPSGGSLVIDGTEAMTVVDVNTGKFTGTGGTLEETVTRNNLEAAEEIVRQLRLRDIGGIIVIDFIDMVLESNRDLVLRRLVECLGRDRTKHQVAEVTSLGLVQMTRKRVGQGLVEAFSEACEHCHGRGFIVHTEPIERQSGAAAPATAASADDEGTRSRSRRKRAKEAPATLPAPVAPALPDTTSEAREAVKATLATIAAAAAHAHEQQDDEPTAGGDPAEPTAAPGSPDGE